ncbi:glycosyltransferase family 2 protein [Bacteroides salyersiae]|uniref:glycosyltransferase family 2 protein n=1 Tax=Bacteroides salyersiae TaxID=291644 RepID=UPI001C8B12DF|nr:glycosyltransferase family 2 protein [Bacteroides salyersiae]
MIQLSVIIITWNQLSYLQECLHSLCPVMKREDVEIIIVDNGSKDGTCQYLAHNYPQVRLHVNVCNKGVAYARNRGLELSQGKKILFLDNDTVANENAISGLETYLDEHPQVGLCACRLVDGNNQIQDSFKPFPGLWLKVKNVLRITKNNALDLQAFTTSPFEPVYVIGACQMIRREVIERIGLLDERIFYGPEDADYCLRIVADGWKVVYLPQYTIIHHWRRATNKKLFSRLAWRHFCALCYFYAKYKRIN